LANHQARRHLEPRPARHSEHIRHLHSALPLPLHPLASAASANQLPHNLHSVNQHPLNLHSEHRLHPLDLAALARLRLHPRPLARLTLLVVYSVLLLLPHRHRVDYSDQLQPREDYSAVLQQLLRHSELRHKDKDKEDSLARHPLLHRRLDMDLGNSPLLLLRLVLLRLVVVYLELQRLHLVGDYSVRLLLLRPVDCLVLLLPRLLEVYSVLLPRPCPWEVALALEVACLLVRGGGHFLLLFKQLEKLMGRLVLTSCRLLPCHNTKQNLLKN
jgi:hypothetical protein